ncbi:MAG: DNA primase [Chloroflexi bacterium]|nr:DNA primase [Chloroflexota bacterium]
MPDSTIDEIKRRLDVVDVIGQTVQLKRAGKGFKGLCPFHGEKTPSFWVTPERGTWHCFGCGEGGDIFSFIQKRDNLSFVEALRFLGERAGVVVEERTRPDPSEKQERERHFAILDAMALYYRGALTGEAGAAARAYIESRGLTDQTIDRFGLGYADAPGRGLERHLTRNGYSIDECVAAGALGRSEDGARVFDRFRDRVIFPIRDVDGHVIGFGGRAMRSDQQPKYLNSPQTDIFDKGSQLYALDAARDTIRKQGAAIVVEGYMDALMAHQAGFSNVVATLGTAITERHVQALRRQSAREIILCLDNDAAGLRAALRGSGVAHDSTRDEAPRIDFSLLNGSERSRGRDGTPAIFVERRTILKAFSLTGGKDPDEVIKTDPEAWVRESTAAKPIVDFVFQNLPRVYDLSTTEGRREAARAAVGLIYDVSDPIDRDQYLMKLAGIIGTGVDLLREFARRTMHVVSRNEAAPQRPASPLGQPTAPTGPAAPTAPPTPPDLPTSLVDPGERLQDFVLALLLRIGMVEIWPEPNDFETGVHRAILQQLQDGPAWPDPETALARLEEAFGEAAAPTLDRVRSRDELNAGISLDDLRREYDVRRLELRKGRLFRQHDALKAALLEEESGQSVAERQASIEWLNQVARSIYETFAEQRQLGVVGTASWSIRRGQEVLGG